MNRPFRAIRLLPGIALAACAAAVVAQQPDRPKSSASRPAPSQAAAFERYLHLVKLRWDAMWLYIDSRGLPDHKMMIDITAWQQQVPLPQDYTGDNAWQVPLRPTPAAEPKSAKTGFFRGAIAIAVNGVPIFNPIKNDGKTDTFLAGELDMFGGHAGRADDYHYHIAPVFLNEGDPSRPIAFALDGYPIYGYDEPDGSPCRPLDEWNGHDDPKIGYHYHATREYPYLNGGFRGVVREEGGQVEPQPHEHPIRPATAPLRGATVTEFERSEDGKTITVTYDQRGRTGTVRYTQLPDGAVRFVFTTPDGTTTEQTYRRDTRGKGGGGKAATAPDNSPKRDAAPAAGEAERQPWLAAHFAELDADRDGILTAAEVDAECARTLSGYDKDGNGRVTPSERNAPGAGRSAMGGFVKQHWQEVDADGDDVVTGAEILATARRMFERADADRDGRVTATEAQGRSGGGDGGKSGQQRGGVVPGRGYAVLEQGFQTEVPEHPYDAILVNPTANSIAVSIVSYRHGDAYVEYGIAGRTQLRSDVLHVHQGLPARFDLRGLKADTEYGWRFCFKPEGGNEFELGEPYTFRTARGPDAAFSFTVTADSHLDEGVSTAVYAQTLANARAARPDFHVDLGDTFMTDKRREFRDAAPQYMAQRYWLGLLGNSVPMFLALGNHDGETGYGGNEIDQVAGWSFAQRTMHFPPPETATGPGAMYTGRTSWGEDGGGNWFAFHWGPALCIVLDPFWNTTAKSRGRGSEVELTDDSWGMTLGRAQYEWLGKTLASSRAPLRFVFLHHLVGGRGRVARGGVEAAPYFEWGGKNADGSDGFAQRRPGWAMPIHALLVRHGVNVVFHGHDHLFVTNELDGIVYQCVPQPGNARGGTRSASDYGYSGGTILGSPGHLRVDVEPRQATVNFVRTVVEGMGQSRRGGEANGEVVHRYRVTPRGTK
jgi:predicted phosphodiesterase